MADCSFQGNFPLANGFQPTADVCSSVAFLIHKWVPQNLDLSPWDHEDTHGEEC